MTELFGISTTSILAILLVILGTAVAAVTAIAVLNPPMFKMGLRNLPRRRTQSVLAVVGLMLSTLIVTASMVTGDTINYSFIRSAEDILARSDLDIAINGEREIADDGGLAIPGVQRYAGEPLVALLEQAFAADPDIEGFLPALYEQAPAMNQRTGDATAAVQLSGFDPARLAALGGLTLASGGAADVEALAADEVFVSESAAADLGARPGDVLVLLVNGTPRRVTVAGIVTDTIASGVLGYSYTNVPGGIAMRLDTLQAFTDRAGQVSAITVALRDGAGDDAASAQPIADRIAAFLADGAATEYLPAPGQTPVTLLKADALAEGQATAEQFTVIFMVLGLFSIAAGIMLIFMIFVMLAAERKAEMGMSRAVGAQRSHLVQAFVVEGMAYSLLAGIPGVIAGVGASLALTLGLLKFAGGDTFSLVQANVTPTSVLIGYSLGAVITFLTVIFASVKVSRVNIVAAIRNLPEDVRRTRQRRSWRWMLAGVATLVVPPIGLWFLLRKGFGLSWTWILAPAGIVAGVLLMLLGESSGQLFPFAAGINLIPLCAAALAARFNAPARITWTTVGMLIIAYWALPPTAHDAIFGELSFDVEMFVLSGIMLVAGSTLVVVFNAGILGRVLSAGNRGGVVAILLAGAAVATAAAGAVVSREGFSAGQLAYPAAGALAAAALLTWAAGRFSILAPALKMAIAYPLANRFRTGMTLAMFSLVIFSLTVFSILLSNFGATVGGDSARGNLDIVASTNPSNVIPDIREALVQAGSDAGDEIVAVGRTTVYSPGQQASQDGDAFAAIPVIAGDDAFYASLALDLDALAEGYAEDGDALRALLRQPGFALIDRQTLRADFSIYPFAADVDIDGDTFTPFQVEIRDAVSGRTATVTVIGELGARLPSADFSGIYITEETYGAVFGEPAYQRLYLRLAEGVAAEAVATQIESALAFQGVDAESVQSVLDRQTAEQTTFNRMFQAFMALGLVVGIAGLGVIAFRSVVERRQQIGMLRAIGYQRTTVAITFLFESSFVAAIGILAGLAGGMVIGRNLMTSDQVTGGGEVATFSIPWPELGIIVLAAWGFSLLLTWFPSYQASKVPVAEALRYE